MVVSGLTLIESNSWENIRKKVYLPLEADEYKSSSCSLTTLSHNVFKQSCSQKDKPLKMGYMVDVCRDGSVTPCALMLGLIYLKRLSVMNPDYLSKISSSDLFLVIMVVASKYLQDEGELEALVNSEWAEIGQRSKSRLDLLEQDFLEAIDWQLFVSPKEYYDFATTVGAQISCTEAESRGWWSYSDLIALWDGSDTTSTVTTTAKQVTKSMGASLAVYLFTFTALLSTSPGPSTTTVTSNITSTVTSTVTSTGVVETTAPLPLLELAREHGCCGGVERVMLHGLSDLRDTKLLKMFKGSGEAVTTIGTKHKHPNIEYPLLYMMNNTVGPGLNNRSTICDWLSASHIDRGGHLLGFEPAYMNLFGYSHNA